MMHLMSTSLIDRLQVEASDNGWPLEIEARVPDSDYSGIRIRHLHKSGEYCLWTKAGDVEERGRDAVLIHVEFRLMRDVSSGGLSALNFKHVDTFQTLAAAYGSLVLSGEWA